MKKILGLVVLASTISVAGMAADPKGVILQRTIGDSAKDKVWSQCQVSPTAITVVHEVNGTKVTETRKITLNAALVEKVVTNASTAEIEKAVHVKETIPHVSIVASIDPSVKEYVLFADGGDMQTRKGKDAEMIIKFVNYQCGDVKFN